MQKKTSESRKIICLTTTLEVLRLYNIFPKKDNEVNPGKLFYIKYIFAALAASVLLVSNSMHLFHTIIYKEYNHIDVDLSNILSLTGSYLVSIFCLLNSNTAAQMYMFLSNFEEYGKPPKFDLTNNILNKISKYHLIYLIIMATMCLFSNVIRRNQCERENVEYGFNEVCGLVANVWLPFDVDYFPMKQVFFLLQSFSIYYIYPPAAIVTFLVMETVFHISIRLDHIKELFIKALNEADPLKRRKKFNFTIKYHGRVLRLEHDLNDSFANCMLIQMILEAAILGCAASGFIQGQSIYPLAVCICWFIALVVVCASGQHLINKSLSIGETIYSETDWYGLDTNLQKDIVMVLMRSQQPMYLQASAFGIMKHTLIVAVIQASFSYIRLLTR